MSEKKIRRAVYAGTFDPITNGHLDVILRAAKIFDEIIVGVADAVHKKTLFTPAERLKLVREVTKDIPNVKADKRSLSASDMFHRFLLHGAFP